MPQSKVSWSMLGAFCGVLLTVAGGVWKVDNTIDAQFKENKVEIRREVADVYARREDVARIDTRLQGMEKSLEEITRLLKE